MDIRALLPLQALDHRLIQLEHQKATVPEIAVAASTRAAFDRANVELRRAEKRKQEIALEVNRLEAAGKDLDARKAKYETQLKSVVVMREVEALQHEIANVQAEHRELDDTELVLLEEAESIETAIATARTELPGLEAAAVEAERARDTAMNLVDTEIGVVRGQRDALAASIDASALNLYEDVRKRMPSGAVAELVRGSCGGCHTAISPKEQAQLKDVANTVEARCPYCSCLLAV